MALAWQAFNPFGRKTKSKMADVGQPSHLCHRCLKKDAEEDQAETRRPITALPIRQESITAAQAPNYCAGTAATAVFLKPNSPILPFQWK